MVSDLKIPVHPHYKLGDAPEGQTQYVNPVTLNNYLIRAVNSHGTIVDMISGVNRVLGKLRAELADADASVEDLEKEMQMEHPAPTNDRKSNKLLEAYLMRIAHTSGYMDSYRSLKELVRTKKREIGLQEVEKDVLFQELQHIKLMSENIKTHLSYVKQETQAALRGF